MKLIIVLLATFYLAGIFSAPTHDERRSAMGRILDVNQDQTGLDVVYGDIKRSLIQDALYQRSWRWPNGVLHYTIRQSDFSSSQIAQIKAGMDDIASKSCVTFVEHQRGSGPSQRVDIIDDGACYSWVGRQQSKQELSLATWGCLYHGTIVHELLHALGFDHEQNRADRDQYVNILWGNIMSGQNHNFELSDTNSLGIPYDPKSVMQYENDAWSSNGGDTIQWKGDKNLRLGGEELTLMDIQQLNLYYECQTGPTTSTTKRPTTTKSTTTTRKPTTKSTTTERSTKTTTTRGPITTTTDMPGGCGDYSFKCVRAYYNKWSVCYNENFRGMCPQSCDVCDSDDEINCMNFKDEPEFDCQTKAEQGHCTIGDYGLRYNMKKKCPKTCCKKGRLYW